MNFSRSFAVLCLAALTTPLSFAATGVSANGFATDPEKPQPASLDLPVPAEISVPSVLSSSSSALPDAPVAGVTATTAGGGQTVLKTPSFRPFSSVAIGVKIGVEGVGFDVATPLNRHLNLRGNASFFSYSPNLTEDGLGITGSLDFKTGNVSLDYYPMGGSFRISPGVTVYNGNHLTANVTVVGGQSFTLDDQTYYSSSSNPVTGIFDVTFGNKVAPSLTMGWGNMIPRKTGQHWSVPFEVGFEYINNPLITLNLTGSACTGQNTGCQPVQSTPSIQSNVQGEQAELQSDISALRIYPILSIGLAYKFGH